MIEDHQQDIAEYEREAKEGVDVAVKERPGGPCRCCGTTWTRPNGLDVGGSLTPSADVEQSRTGTVSPMTV